MSIPRPHRRFELAVRRVRAGRGCGWPDQGALRSLWAPFPATAARLLDQRYQPPLRVAIAVDVALGRLNGPVPRQELDVPQ
jgi:hypothetical protein